MATSAPCPRHSQQGRTDSTYAGQKLHQAVNHLRILWGWHVQDDVATVVGEPVAPVMATAG